MTRPTRTPCRGSTKRAALASAIEDVAPNVLPAIKWPNDVLIDGRKVAGVLAETAWDGREFVAIVGVGVNVSASSEIDTLGATSLSHHARQPIARADLFEAFVRQLDAWRRRPTGALRTAWQARLWGRGQRLRLADLGHEEDVTVLGVTSDGSLRVRLANGSERVTSTGELIL